MIRTRFAPSPTGPLHMGGVRTALYAWLFAKKHNGKFLLRIEDTDQNRFVPGAEHYITEALAWCGITIDEGPAEGGPFAPYRQSERKELGYYKQYAQKLVDAGHAYYAFDTPQGLEEARKNAEASGNPGWQYDATHRMQMLNSLTLDASETEKRITNGDGYVIRLKVEPGEHITFTDMVRGEVTFDSSLVDDKVLIKADGMPTYHLAHIVDDIMMEITHAIRGEEWLPSAPAHILIYKYLGLENNLVQYAHLPLLLKPEGNGKLSKRDGDRLGFPVFPLEWKDPATGEISSGYREKGYYPQAFVNMLALLGWNPGTEQELFSLDELINAFSFERVHKSGARFDPEKTKWFNEQYLRQQPSEEIATRLVLKLPKLFSIAPDDRRVQLNYVTNAVNLMKDRVAFESEIAEKAGYLFIRPDSYDEKVISKKWNENSAVFFEALMQSFATVHPFTAAEIKTNFEFTCGSTNTKPGDVLQLLRVLVSGQGSGVDLFGMLELFGKEESLERLRAGINKLGVKS